MNTTRKALRLQAQLNNAVSEYNAAATDEDASKWVSKILRLNAKLAAL